MSTRTPKTILLVDDERSTVMLISRQLQRFGYTVIGAASGEEAVHLAAGDEAIALILMDILLGPGIDGPEAARQILAARDIPIVFLSSHTEPDIVGKVHGIPRYGYVLKNSGDAILRSAIDMAFELFDAHETMRANAEAMRESESRFRAMADASPVLMWMAGTDKLCDYFNSTWLAFTGRTLEQEQGNGWREGVHTADLSRCVETFEQAFDTRRPFSMEYRLR